MANVGERLESIRRLRMWTQVRLAREAGVSPTTVSAIETGKIGRPQAVHKASDPGGGGTVGLGEDFGHGSPQPARRQALIAYQTK
jgi:hypothetical protein